MVIDEAVLCELQSRLGLNASRCSAAGNAGLGAETVRALALQGAEVIIGSRSLSKAEQAVHAFEQDAGKVKAGCHPDFCHLLALPQQTSHLQLHRQEVEYNIPQAGSV